MSQLINIQIHDYDRLGNYRIVEDRKATKNEVLQLKWKAQASVRADWDKLPKEARHIVYYAELLDRSGNVWYASIYMHGQAYDEKDFDRTFHTPVIGYVGAIHKKDLPDEFKH